MAAISDVLKTKSDDDEEPKKKSREDWRKAKELEEARKVNKSIIKIYLIYVFDGYNEYHRQEQPLQQSMKRVKISIHTFHNIYHQHPGIMELLGQHSNINVYLVKLKNIPV